MKEKQFLNQLSDDAAAPSAKFLSNLKATAAATAVAGGSNGLASSVARSRIPPASIVAAVVTATVGVSVAVATIGDTPTPIPQDTEPISQIEAPAKQVAEPAEPKEEVLGATTKPEPIQEPVITVPAVAYVELEPVVPEAKVEPTPKKAPDTPPEEAPDDPLPVEDPPIIIPPATYNVEYWELNSFTAPPEPPTTLADKTELHENIDFDWGGDSPHPDLQPNYIYLKITSTQYFEAGFYDVTTLSDDGVRVSIGGDLVIDNWTNHGPQTDTANVEFEEDGLQDIEIHYYERNGGATLEFTIEPEAPQPPVVTL